MSRATDLKSVPLPPELDVDLVRAICPDGHVWLVPENKTKADSVHMRCTARGHDDKPKLRLISKAAEERLAHQRRMADALRSKAS